MPHTQGKEPGLDDADYFATFGDLWTTACDRLVKVDFRPAEYKLELEHLRDWLDTELKRLATTEHPF